MRRRIVLPNVMTALSLTSGLFIIFKLSLLPSNEGVQEQLSSCLGLLIIAAILDTLDGALARAMGMESDFGGFFDSMSDAVTFGVAPSVMVLRALSPVSGTVLHIFIIAAAMAYSIAGVLRLVRFSTSSVPPEHKGVFTGLPIPAAAFSTTSFVLFGLSSAPALRAQISIEAISWICGGAIFIVAYLMISRWRFPSVKALNVKVKSFQIIAFLACLTPVFYFLVISSVPRALFIGSWGYIVISWFLALYRLATGKRHLAINDNVIEDEGDLVVLE